MKRKNGGGRACRRIDARTGQATSHRTGEAGQLPVRAELAHRSFICIGAVLLRCAREEATQPFTIGKRLVECYSPASPLTSKGVGRSEDKNGPMWRGEDIQVSYPLGGLSSALILLCTISIRFSISLVGVFSLTSYTRSTNSSFVSFFFIDIFLPSLCSPSLTAGNSLV